jgi:hypothetical protein
MYVNQRFIMQKSKDGLQVEKTKKVRGLNGKLKT